MRRLIFAIGWVLCALLTMFVIVYGLYSHNYAPLPFATIATICSIYNSISDFTRWKKNKEIEKQWKSPIEGGIEE